LKTRAVLFLASASLHSDVSAQTLEAAGKRPAAHASSSTLLVLLLLLFLLLLFL
jgi:hypothetical protein